MDFKNSWVGFLVFYIKYGVIYTQAWVFFQNKRGVIIGEPVIQLVHYQITSLITN